MKPLQQLRGKVTALEKLLSNKPVLPIKESEIQQAISELEELNQRLKKYYKAPVRSTKQDITAAKAHPVSVRIVNFTKMDKGRKQFFDLAYFKRKFQALPGDKKIVRTVLSGKEAASGYLDALLLYHYWKGQPSPDKSLGLFLLAIETDYRDNPAGRQIEEAKRFFRKLLSEKTIGKISAALKTKYPSEAELKEFARLTNLKIPAAGKGKAGPKKDVHQRLAKEIFNQGALVRMDLGK